MEQERFERRLSELKSSISDGILNYGFRNNDEIWKNIGSNPSDKLFTEIAEFYLESNDSQKQTLYDHLGIRNEYLENAWYFIRRIATLINNQKDNRWLEIGIASALMDGGRADFRDLIVSLVLLRFMAEKRGIDTQSVFDKFVQFADGITKDILMNVRDHSESSVKFNVNTFGHPDWKEY
jgi:hypothetical protein